MHGAKLFLLCLCAGIACANAKAPCDDEMGGDTGSGLKLVRLPKPRPSQPPKAQAWVAPLVTPLLTQRLLDNVFSYPKGVTKKGCTLKSFTYSKLCVPSNGKAGNFRVKVSVSSSCGQMNVKMRVAVSGARSTVDAWGRSASRR